MAIGDAGDIADDLASRRNVTERIVRILLRQSKVRWPGARIGGAALTLAATIIRQRRPTCDRVARYEPIVRAGDIHTIAAIDRDMEAATFGANVREGSRRNGGRISRSHARLGVSTALTLREAVRSGFCLGHIAVMQGAVWQAMGLGEELAQLASAYGVASGVVGRRAARRARRARRTASAGRRAVPHRRARRAAGLETMPTLELRPYPGDRRRAA